MNGINRRGQKVECIAGMAVYHRDFDNPTGDPVPVQGKVYTVDDFIPAGVVFVEYIGFLEKDGPGIVLREVPTVKCTCCDKVMGWPMGAFRPVTDRKNDAEAFIQQCKDAIARTTVKKPEPVE